MKKPPQALTLDDFRYDLPESSIAQAPAETRDAARLMLLDRLGEAEPRDTSVAHLADLVTGDELLVLNDTRVVPARLAGRKPTGGAVELLVVEPVPERPGRVVALAKASKPLRPGARVELQGGSEVVIETAYGQGYFEVSLPAGVTDPWEFLAGIGEVPLPPYIKRPDGPLPDDDDRYQTVYARVPGAVAAPTAGLHLTTDILAALERRGVDIAYVTLHVGPGTFLPVRCDSLDDHEMHSERYEISDDTAEAIRSARADGRPVLAVGTTTVRALEGCAALNGRVIAETARTNLFIRPGYRFRVVDQLLTNFHLPGSTLLMLVSAFASRDCVMSAYTEAVRRGYHFYSYGDAMLLR